MPFDSLPGAFHHHEDLSTHIARLEILRGLLERQQRPWQQISYEKCLWFAASRHRGLLVAGLAPYVRRDTPFAAPPSDEPAAAAFFALSTWIWGPAPKAAKLRYIRDAQSCLPAERLPDDEAAGRVAVALAGSVCRHYDDNLVAWIDYQASEYLERRALRTAGTTRQVFAGLRSARGCIRPPQGIAHR